MHKIMSDFFCIILSKVGKMFLISASHNNFTENKCESYLSIVIYLILILASHNYFLLVLILIFVMLISSSN